MNGHRVEMQIAGLDNACNRAINYAIDISQQYKCENVNTAHVFIGIVKETAFGEIFSTYTDIQDMQAHNKLKISLGHLVDNGDFGHADRDFIEGISIGRLDFLSPALGQTIARMTTEAFTTGALVGYSRLLQEILDRQEIYLMRLLDLENLTVEDIEEMLKKNCTIPDTLSDFVRDMTTDKRILNTTYVDTDRYTDEMIEVLGRKKKPNPLLVGKAGVGKTAIAEAFAQRVAHGDVPEFLKGTHICSVDGSVLTAGTRYRGDFEARMKMLMDFAEESDIILFIDELHAFVNAGSGVQGAENAGNMIKTKMNDGLIRIIGATTHKEFKKFVEHDEALCRRMEDIEVKEPSLEDAVNIVCDSIVDYEQFHEVNIPDSSIELAARLSEKYMKADSFPDKIFTVIDHASSYAKVHNIADVDDELIEKTVSKITGISVDKMTDANIKNLLKLEETLSKYVIGQPEAINTVSKAIRRGKAGITDGNRPLASFLFVGPTGVGKTELCKVLSKEVALGDMPLIRVDMSEFSDKIAVNKMIGSAPGYVGYGEGGQLTEKIKHNPYSLILFDEIEKAHPDVFDIFLQLLDDGRLSDSEGQTIDFTNCIVVMTSNAWISKSNKLGFGSSQTKEEERRESEKRALEDLEKTFKPEFLNRIDNIILFNKLTEEQCENITRLLLDKLNDRVYNEKKVKLTFSDKLITYLTHKGYSDKYGARNIRREIQNTVEDVVALQLLYGVLKEGTTSHVYLNDDNEVMLEEA